MLDRHGGPQSPGRHIRDYRNAQYRLGKVGRLQKLIGDQKDRSTELSVFGKLFELGSYVAFETLSNCNRLYLA